jgi:hypothetical protein
MVWTDEMIHQLIVCPKIVVEPPKETNKGGRGGFVKKSFTLASQDGQHMFSGFITQSVTFPENFSIGLVYSPKSEKGSTVLLRCNGKHGGTIQHPHHAFFHIHYAGADRINNGLKAEGDIRITEEYATMDTAFEYFVDLVNIEASDRNKMLPSKKIQTDLFDNEY